MAINRYFAVFLLLISFNCTHANDTEKSEIDMEMFASRNRLLDSMFNESIALDEFLTEKSDEVCQKILDFDVDKNVTSEELASRNMILSNCVHLVMDRLKPATSRHGAGLLKIVDQKYEEFYEEIVRRIDEYLKGLTVEQQSKTTTRNLRIWSSKIKNAPTLTAKEIAYRSCMRYYHFENGV